MKIMSTKEMMKLIVDEEDWNLLRAGITFK
ncbi:hypothetical protein AVEN_186545-1, partial [Araneus ventricosus]